MLGRCCRTWEHSPFFQGQEQGLSAQARLGHITGLRTMRRGKRVLGDNTHHCARHLPQVRPLAGLHTNGGCSPLATRGASPPPFPGLWGSSSSTKVPLKVSYFLSFPDRVLTLAKTCQDCTTKFGAGSCMSLWLGDKESLGTSMETSGLCVVC